MCALEIDAVNVFARSHYMPLFSRLGTYDTDALDRLLFSSRGPYVEYWAHVASFIPAADCSLFAFRMQELREKYSAPGPWVSAHPDTLASLRAALAERGRLPPAQSAADLDRDTRGPWWVWGGVRADGRRERQGGNK